VHLFKTPSYAEPELLSLTAQGDREAFAQLFYYWHPRLSSFVFKMTGSGETTEEIVLDVFTRIWLKKELLCEVQNFQGYLFVMTRHLVLNEFRKTVSRQARERRYASEQPEAGDDGFDALSEKQTREFVDKALAVLPARQRQIWKMSRRENLTYIQIADLLHISRETVKSHLKEATVRLTQYLKTHQLLLLFLALSVI